MIQKLHRWYYLYLFTLLDHPWNMYCRKKSRHIRQQFRQQLWEELDHQSPSTLHNKLYSSLSKHEIQWGKWDKVGSSVQTIEKISSVSNYRKGVIFDVVNSLSLLWEQQLKLSTGTKVKGYVQWIYVHPFPVMCYTEEGILLYHHLAKTHCLFWCYRDNCFSEEDRLPWL